MEWRNDVEDLPEGSVLNMEHRNLTPDEYNHADPLYTPQFAAGRSD